MATDPREHCRCADADSGVNGPLLPNQGAPTHDTPFGHKLGKAALWLKTTPTFEVKSFFG